MFPIYKKELQSFFYTPFAYAITALFLFMFTYVFTNSIANMDSSMLQFSFAEIFYSVIALFVYLIPIMTMRTFPDERKFGTEVLLMTSPVNTFKIVIAKYLANLTIFAFMLVCSFIFPVVTSAYGEVVISQLFCAYLGFFCWGAMCIALGMLVSSFTENSIIAAIFGEVVMLLTMFVDEFSNSDFIAQYPGVQSVLYSFAAQPKFAYFAQSLIRVSDIIFFISAIVVLLAWTIISIEKRRWNRG